MWPETAAETMTRSALVAGRSVAVAGRPVAFDRPAVGGSVAAAVGRSEAVGRFVEVGRPVEVGRSGTADSDFADSHFAGSVGGDFAGSHFAGSADNETAGFVGETGEFAGPEDVGPADVASADSASAADLVTGRSAHSPAHSRRASSASPQAARNR